MKRFIIGLIVAVISVTGLNVDSAYAVKNEFFKQGNNVEFSSADAGALGPTGDFVYYSQNDPRWQNTLYGQNDEGATIGESGCAPTSLAMIVATLVDKSVTPVDTAQAGFDNGSFIPGVGSAHAPLIEGAIKRGWNFTQTTLTNSTIEEVMQFLQDGKGYVYVSGTGPAPFTSAGHIVVIKGADIAAGTLTIADPYRNDGDVYPKSVVDSYRGTTIGITK